MCISKKLQPTVKSYMTCLCSSAVIILDNNPVKNQLFIMPFPIVRKKENFVSSSDACHLCDILALDVIGFKRCLLL